MAASETDAAPIAVAGVVLAAGGGTRYGSPKALVRGADGVPWLQHAVQTLAASGCSPVLVLLGAGAAEAESLLAESLLAKSLLVESLLAESLLAECLLAESLLAESLLAGTPGAGTRVVVVRVPDWTAGLSASLRAGLAAVALLRPAPPAVAVVPVDVPDLTVATVQRVLGHDRHDAPPPAADSLRQAVFGGRPGHPVLIGRDHWAPLTAGLAGDEGARPYLVAHGVHPVECGDLSSGLDVDRPPAAPG